MLAWFSVWSEVQTCIYPSWCHCHSLSLALVKSRLVLPFWYRLTQVVPDKGLLNVYVCVLTVILLDPFNSLFSRTTWVSRYQKDKTSLDLNEAARDDGVLGCSGISRTICEQSAPRLRQVSTPTPHHSIFYGLYALPDIISDKVMISGER